MFSIAKRITSGVVAAAIVIGTLAVYPKITGKNTMVNAAELKYDSASAINYATILGGAVDYGIVADTVIQNNHTETTFATNHFIHNSDNIDVDYISSTALFLIGESYTPGSGDNRYIRFGTTTASAIYFEAPQSIYGSGFDSSLTNPPIHNQVTGNFRFEANTPVPFIPAVNENAKVNVNRLINRVCSETVVEDAEKGWSYFLSDRANSGEYRLPSSYIDVNGSFVDINVDKDEFKGKVVYVNVTNDMLKALGTASQFKIHKDPSTVVVLNIGDITTDSALLLNKPVVVVGGKEYAGETASNGGEGNQEKIAEAMAVQKNYNETVIWNITAAKDVNLQACGGAVLAPNAGTITLSSGNSSGWIVTAGTVDMKNEFHFLYSGSSRDSYGQMHFALTKAFTQRYASHGNVVQDTSVSISENTYKFYIQEYEVEGSASPELEGRGRISSSYGSAKEVFADQNGAVTFPSLQFFCDNTNLVDDHYYIPKPVSDTPNYKMFYFRITEDQANSPEGISNSDGYIDIRLKVEVDKNGNFTYFVDYMSVTGKDPATGENIVFRRYGEVYGDYIKMSGVQFDLGAFYNKTTGNLTVTKTVFGDELLTTAPSSYEFYLKCDGKYVQDSTTGKLGSTPYAFTVDPSSSTGTKITGLELGKTYVVEEVEPTGLPSGVTCKTTYSAKDNAYLSSDDPSQTIGIINTYTQTTTEKGYVDITKTFGGDVTDEDFSNLVFEIYEEGVQTPVKTYSFGTDFEYDSSTNSYSLKKKFEAEVNKNYYVKETNYDREHKTVSATYSLNGTQGNGFTTGSFSVTTANTSTSPYEVEFNNLYELAPGSIKVTKVETGDIPASGKPVSYIFYVKCGDKYVQNDRNGALGNDKHPFTVSTSGPAVISGLALDKTYTVIEANVTEIPSNYQCITSYTNDGEVTLSSSNSTGTVEITNNYIQTQSGSLTVTKTVDGDVPQDAPSTYSFYVKCGNLYVQDETSGILAYAPHEFSVDPASSTGTVISGLGLDKTYVVEEVVLSDISKDYTYETAYTNSSVTLDSNTPDGAVGITNTYSHQSTTNKGSLTISKTITLPAGASLSDIDNITFTINGSSSITLDPDNPVGWEVNGNTFTHTYNGLNAGTTYKIVETSDGANNSFSILAVSPADKTREVVIPDNSAVSADFSNKYKSENNPTGSLIISKTINLGEGVSIDNIQPIVFAISPDIKGTTSIELDPNNLGSGWEKNGSTYTYRFDGLTPNSTYIVEETAADGSSEEYVLYSVTPSTKSCIVTIPENASDTAAFENTYKSAQQSPTPTPGYIKITKTFGGDVTGEDFNNLSFELYEVDNSTVPVTETKVTTFNLKDHFTVEPGTGKYVLTNAYPVDSSKTYSVKEINYTKDHKLVSATYTLNGGSEQDGFNATGITVPDTYNEASPYIIAFDNEYKLKTGELQINKVITSGTNDDGYSADTIFTVKVRFSAAGTYEVKTATSSTYADMEFKADEDREFTLKAGQTIAIKGITEDTSYTVSEVTPQTAGYSQDGEVENGTGTIIYNNTVTATVKNKYENQNTVTPTPTAAITVTKNVVVDPGNFANSTFAFTLKGSDNNYYGADGKSTGTTATPITFSKSAQRVITGLPAGLTYTVNEITDENVLNTAYRSGYDLTVAYNNGTSAVNSISIPANGGTGTISVSNSYSEKTVTLDISKKTLAGEEIKGATLELTGTAPGGAAITFTQSQFNGASDAAFTSDGNSLKFVSGTSASTISGLGDGDYVLTETDVPGSTEGTYTKATDITFTISGGKVTSTNVTSTVVTENENSYVEATSSTNAHFWMFDNFTKNQNTTPVPTGAITVSKSVVDPDNLAPQTEYKFTVSCSQGYVQDETSGAFGSDAHEFTISANGSIDITGLELGYTYTVEEVAVTGTGFICTAKYTDSKDVTLDLDNRTKSVAILNTYTSTNSNTPSGTLTVSKTVTGSTSSSMADYEYKFTVKIGDEYVQDDQGALGPDAHEFTLKDGDSIDISNLLDGDYFVEEVSVPAAPSDYSWTGVTYTSSQKVTIDSQNGSGSGSVIIVNDCYYSAPTPAPTKGSITITKDIVSGAPAEAYNKVYVFTVSGNGQSYTVNIDFATASSATLSDLAPGTYTITEDKSAASISNYNLAVANDGVSVTVVAGDDAPATITNEYSKQNQTPQPTSGHIVFTKTFGGDVTEKEAQGCGLYFVITDTNGMFLQLDGTLTSTETRITLADLAHPSEKVWGATIDNVPFGVYTVTEHNEAIYIAGGNVPYTFEKSSVITDTTTVSASSIEGKLVLTNEYTHPGFDVTISKQDIAGKEIAQAYLKFKSMDGYDLSKVIVTQNGKSVAYTLSENNTAITFVTVEGYPSIIQGLFAGEYELEETVTPEAYLTAEKITFRLNADGTVTDGNGKVSVYGSPIVMIDKADPTYQTSVISANRSPIPSTGEGISYYACAGVMALGMCAAGFVGFGMYRRKKDEV